MVYNNQFVASIVSSRKFETKSLN